MAFIAPQSDLAPPNGVNAFGDPVLGGTPAAPNRVSSIADAVFHGLQSNALGLAIRKQMPEQQMPDTAPWYHRAAAGVAGAVSDLPIAIPAGVAGFFGGAAAGTTVAPGIGTAMGGLAGAGAAGFGVPMAIRDALIEAYSNNHATSWEGVWEIAKAGMKGGGKGMVIGGLTGVAGPIVGRAVGTTIAPAVGKTISASTAVRTIEGAALTAELGTMTTTAAALEGRLPTAQDFMDNAILLGGLKGTVAVSKNLYNVYANVGKHPTEIAVDSAADPKLKADLALTPEQWKARQAEAAIKVQEAEAKVNSLLEKDAPYSDVVAARNEARAARTQYDAATNALPEAYIPLAQEQRVKAALENSEPAKLAAMVLEHQRDPNFKPATDPVGYDYITTPEARDAVIREVASATKDALEKQTRGVRKVEATMAAAKDAVEAGEVAKRVIGEGANAEQIAAHAMLTAGATARANRILQELAQIPPEKLTLENKLQFAAAMEQVSMFYGDLVGAGAEVGRALNILGQIKRRPELMGDAEALLKIYEKRGGNVSDFAALAKDVKNAEQMRVLAKAMQTNTLMEDFVSTFRAFIFSGPQTWAANLMGNLAKIAIDIPEAAMQAAYLGLKQAGKGDPLKMAQFKARALAPFYGIQLAALDGIHLAAEGARVLRERGAIAAGHAFANKVSEMASGGVPKLETAQNQSKGVAGKFQAFSFGMLAVQDLPFRTIGERTQSYIMAVDRAVKEGLHPNTKEFTETVSRYTYNPELGLSAKNALKVREAIEQAGSEAVFGQKLGPTLQSLQRMTQTTPSLGLTLPAIRTPANLLSWVVQRVPGLNFLSERWRTDYMAGGEQQAKALARVTIGAGLAATAIGLSQSGVLTGGGLTDREQAATKGAAGVQNYSLLVDGQYYSIQRIEPVAKLFMLAGDLTEIMNSKAAEEDKAKAAQLLVLAFANATISTTYMSGLSNAMRAVLDPARYGDAFVEGYATAIVPKVISQPVVMADPYKREVDGVLDAIQSQLPILRERLLPKRDVWGQPSQNNRWFDVLPVATSKASTDKVKTEAVRLQLAITNAPESVFERGPLKPSERKVELSQQQKDVYQQASGTFAMSVLSPFVNSADWDRLPNFVQASMYQKAFRMAHQQGVNKALPPTDPARIEARQKLMDEVNRQFDEVEKRTTEKRIKAEK